MSKTQDIREKFEAALVDVLRGRPAIDKDGVCLTHEDGTPVLERAGASDLAVVRAYLKDQAPVGDPKQPQLPQTGEASTLLKSFAEKKGLTLPFAGRTQ